MVRKKIKALSTVLFMIILFSGLSFGYWADGYDFQYRKDITIDSSKIDANLSYFPVLVKLTSSNIDFSHFLHGTNDGYDIRFSAAIDGGGNATGAPLDYERERFDKSGEVAEIWVEIPTVNSGSDTTFYMFYGNTGCVDGQDIEHTWDGGTDVSPANNYAAVWHLHDDFLDSTSNSNNGTNYQSSDVSAKIADGQDFDGNDDYINVGSGASIDNIFNGSSNGGTIEAWIYPEGWGGGGYGRILDKATGTLGQGGWTFLVNNYNNWERCSFIRYFSSARGFWYTDDYTISLNTWQHVAVTYDENSTTNDPTFYIQSAPVTFFEDTTPSGTPVDDAAQTLYIGNLYGGSLRTFDGVIDEVRISNIIRSAAWVKASYHSGNDSLLTIPTLVELSYFRATSLDYAALLEWATETELDNAGFNIWRSEEKDGEYVRINPYFIPAEGEAGFGAEYSFTDYDVQNDTIYYYLLEDIDIHGKSTFHGPVSANPNDIIPIWPPDRIIRPSEALVFSWSISGSNSFKVEISPNPSFPASETFSYPDEGWTPSNSLWLSLNEWEMVLRKATQSGGQLFWRVRARSEEDSVICSEWRKLILKERIPPGNRQRK